MDHEEEFANTLLTCRPDFMSNGERNWTVHCDGRPKNEIVTGKQPRYNECDVPSYQNPMRSERRKGGEMR